MVCEPTASELIEKLVLLQAAWQGVCRPPTMKVVAALAPPPFIHPLHQENAVMPLSLSKVLSAALLSVLLLATGGFAGDKKLAKQEELEASLRKLE